MPPRGLWVVALAAIAGCYSPGYGNCVIACAANGCPSGLSCDMSSGLCHDDSVGSCVLPGDGSFDSPSVPFDAPWGTQTVIDFFCDEPALTFDLNTLYCSDPNNELLYLTRTAGQPFANATLLTDPNSTGTEGGPHISADGTQLIFSSNGHLATSRQIFIATRVGAGPDYTNVMALEGGINTVNQELTPAFSPDGTTIVYSADVNDPADIDGFDLFMSEADDAGGFGVGMPITSCNTAEVIDSSPALSADKLTLYFHSTRNGGLGGFDIWRAHRATTSEPFGQPENVTELNTAKDERDPWLSADDHHLFFSRGELNMGGTRKVVETSR